MSDGNGWFRQGGGEGTQDGKEANLRKWPLAAAALVCVLALVIGAYQVGRIRGREEAIAVEARYSFWFTTLLKSLRVLELIEKNEPSQLRSESEGDLMTSLENVAEVIDRMDHGSSDYIVSGRFSTALRSGSRNILPRCRGRRSEQAS